MLLTLLACRTEPTPEPTPPADTGHTAVPGDPHSAEPHTGAPGHTAEPPIQAVAGAWCAPDEHLGVVQVLATSYGPPALWVQVWDRPEPAIGAPARTTSTCAFHQFDPGTCGTCPVGEQCGVDGCTPQPRTDKHLTIELRSGRETETYTADPVLGTVYAELDFTDPDVPLSATVTWGGLTVEVPPTAIASGDLGEVHVTVPSSDFTHPGGLDAAWEAPTDGGVVRSRVPINHHADGATFTECVADGAAERFHADAAMIDPLAVITGLEFQGLEHWQTAAATVPGGCLDVRFGRLLYVPVEVP